MYLTPTFLKATEQFYLNKCISLSVAEFIRNVGCKNVEVKWPNDVLVNGKKIAGILIENSVRGNFIQSAIVGIGININQIQFSFNGSEYCSSLALETQFEHNLEAGLGVLCEIIEYRYLKFKTNSKCFDQEYLEQLYQYEQVATYSIKGKGEVFAQIKSVNNLGQLILVDEYGNEFSCNFKEVEFLR